MSNKPGVSAALRRERHGAAGLFLFLVALGAGAVVAEAQQAKVYRVGVILQGGPYYAAIDGLREGLRELGSEEGKAFILDIRDAKGDLKAVEEAARGLAGDKVHLIYALAGSVTNAAKRATADIPIVFSVGSDPVTLGLVESIPRPGGRLTGVHFQLTDLTGKRLEILKEIVPRVSRVVTFYDPSNRGAKEAAMLGREAARQLGIQFVERHVASVDELQLGLRALKAGEVDAYFFTSDAMVASQAQLIIDTAKAKKLPTMFHEQSLVERGGLASYGLSFREIGRMSAKYVHRILAGVQPRDLPVERVHKLELALNLRTARELGLAVPQEMLMRADKLIQ
ncbi:MAG: ABC transporter substrate-binding protein [Candidatus Rokubacteria bacterium]|nr:ABC transporter substrate-binding protein [Candidatus Rokubacteria bacterium]